MEIKRVEIKIIGRVQGVFFRSEAQKRAQTSGLTGWIKNESDGSLTIVAEGEEENLQKFIAWCKKGTEYSQVKQVDAIWPEATGEFSHFEIFR